MTVCKPLIITDFSSTCGSKHGLETAFGARPGKHILGSLERFTGILIEHYEGKFPLWLAPIQLVIATITSKADKYAHAIEEKFIEKGIRVILDTRNEKINYKVREHSVNKIPYIFAVGVNEMNEKTVAIRKLGSDKQETLSLVKAIQNISKKNQFPIN